MSTLVLITGTGRSGTSTMSGTLHHLGLYVPGPHLGANDSNPKGFFESRWAVSFHKEIVKAAGIHEFDSRPTALERVQSVITDEHRQRLVAFLKTHADAGDAADQLVVKDPRSVWTQSLWREAAAEVGRDTVYISMLRHPAEVVGSRATYYANPGDEDQRRRYEIFNVARWINSSVVNERETRGRRRAFVRYNDLLEDWRTAVLRLGEGLDLSFGDELAAPSGAHAVDEFIDPDLRRHAVTWEDLSVPADLQDLAEQIWDRLVVLGDAGGVDQRASIELDQLSSRYRRLFEDATAVSHDAIEEVARDARHAGVREGRAKATGQVAPRTRPPGQLVEETGGRDLLRIVGRRALGRLHR